VPYEVVLNHPIIISVLFVIFKMADMKGSALIILADGAEEMEAVITADVLRRGKVTLATCFLCACVFLRKQC